MKDTELTQSQARALYGVYKKGLEEGRFSSLSNAAEWVRRQPAPCFYISSKRASILVGMIQSGVSLLNQGYNMRRMAWQLFRKYKEYRKENPDTDLSRERILELIVDSPAPEFYLSAEAVRHILFNEIKKSREMKW